MKDRKHRDKEKIEQLHHISAVSLGVSTCFENTLRSDSELVNK